MTLLTRRSFVGAAATAVASVSLFGLAGCSSSGSGSSASSSAASSASSSASASVQDPTASPAKGDYTLRVGLQQTNINPVAVIIAKEKGWFEEEGVSIEWETVDTPNNGIAAISEDKLDVMNAGALGNFEAVATGVQNVYFCGGIMSEGSDYIVKADSDITSLKSAEDFRGKTIVGFQIDPGRMETVDFLLKAGMKENVDYNMIVVAGTSEVIAAVTSGEAEIGITNGGASYTPIKNGEVKQVALVHDFVGDYPCCRLMFNDDVYENHYEEVVGYIIAELRGYQFFKNNMEETIKIESAFTGGARDEENCQAHGYGIEGVYTTAMGIQMDPDTEAIVKFYQLMKDISEAGDVGTSLDPNTKYDILDVVYVGAYEEALGIMMAREPEEQLWEDMMATFKKKNAQAKH